MKEMSQNKFIFKVKKLKPSVALHFTVFQTFFFQIPKRTVLFLGDGSILARTYGVPFIPKKVVHNLMAIRMSG